MCSPGRGLGRSIGRTPPLSQRPGPAVATHFKCVQNPVGMGTPPPSPGNKCQKACGCLLSGQPGHPHRGDFGPSIPRIAYLNARPISAFSISSPYRDKRWGVCRGAPSLSSVAVPESGARKEARPHSLATCQVLCQQVAKKKPLKSLFALRGRI